MTPKRAPTKDPGENNYAILATDASRPASLLGANILPVCALLARLAPGVRGIARTPRSDTLILVRVLIRCQPHVRNRRAGRERLGLWW